jgi:hypothetical protein
MLTTFSRTLADKLNQIHLEQEVRQAVYEQRVKLAGVELPPSLVGKTRQQVEKAIAVSFVSGFRLIMFTSAGLAFASALSSWLLIGSSPASTRQRAN